MNDFTKEELVNLLACVKSNKAYHLNHMEIIYPILLNKIQSMIDNYCGNPWIDRNMIWPSNIEKVEFKYEDNIAVGIACRDKDGNHIDRFSYVIHDNNFNPSLITHWRRCDE